MFIRRLAAQGLIVLMAIGLVVTTASPTLASTSLRVCGIVRVYAAATAVTAGLVTIGPAAVVVARGAVLPAEVAVGANLCLDLHLNASGQVTAGSASASLSSTITVCGTISAYAAASATTTGSLTIAGRTFALALGSHLPASVRAGADLCLSVTLNGFGQVSGGSASANLSSTIDVCGTISAYAAASATTTGSLTIGAFAGSIAAGARVDSRVRVGLTVNLRLTLNAFAEISDATVLALGASMSATCPATGGPSPTPSPSPRAPSPSPSPMPSAGASGAPGPSCGNGAKAGAGTIGTNTVPPTGPIPDSASLARTGGVVLTTGFPFALLALGALGGVVFDQRRKRILASRGTSEQVSS